LKEGIMREKLLFLFVMAVIVGILTAPYWAPAVDAEPRYPSSEIIEKAGFLNLATAATTTVKTGAGSLASIVINGGTMGSITVYDSLAGSGTKIATIAAPLPGMVLPYGVRFATGLTIVAAANTDFTVCFY
jgi:hypothetical protein